LKRAGVKKRYVVVVVIHVYTPKVKVTAPPKKKRNFGTLIFIWMMSNDDPIFLSAFIEYLDNNFLSRKEKKII
jgi:hypothetical protein